MGVGRGGGTYVRRHRAVVIEGAARGGGCIQREIEREGGRPRRGCTEGSADDDRVGGYVQRRVDLPLAGSIGKPPRVL